MKAFVILALLGLTTPALAAIEPHATLAGSQTPPIAAAPEAGAPIVLARDVIVGPRGRAVVVGPRGRARVVGPRGRARTFVYRGRPLAVYRGPRYAYPRGFGYRRWRAGQLFPLALLAAPFAFAEYQALGLEPPPPGYRWYRYGPDVVLVNSRTREVEDVAYGAVDDED